jgi:segregation and condensation protein A
MHRVPISVRLEHFQGPLDLLLYLIQSHELDISKVSVSHITDQFVAYVRLMQELNFDIASEFLVMAATLLHWKSKALLPQENKGDAAGAAIEGEELTRDQLIRQLLEHQRFLAAGQDLAQLPRLGEDVFSRPNKRPPIEKVWKPMDVTSLSTTYQDILTKARKRKTILKKETVSLSDKLHDFREKLEVGRMTELTKLLSPLAEKPEVVVTFLASLELSRLKKLRVHQELTYGPILLELIESLRNFDLSLASGFDAEGAIKGVDEAVKAAEMADKKKKEAEHENATSEIPLHVLENQGAELAPSMA